MKLYTYSEARQKLSEVLDRASTERVAIKRRGGETFEIVRRRTPASPFDVPGVRTKVTTAEIIAAVGESRSRT
jgi:prevent-host-death family protein